MKEENLTIDEFADKEKKQLKGEKHKSLKSWMNKLEAMQVILLSQDDIGK